MPGEPVFDVQRAPGLDPDPDAPPVGVTGRGTPRPHPSAKHLHAPLMRDVKGSIRRIGGYLHRVVPIVDDAGRIIHYVTRPVMVEFRLRDVMQVVVGSALLATPLAFTGEAWDLGANLPLVNCLILTGLALLFVGVFTYANFYRGMIAGHVGQFLTRVATTYLFSLAFVALLLGLLEQTPWQTDWETALKRVLLVGFPACLAGTAADALK